MRQILYVSASTVPGDKADVAGILEQSRHNNALEGITGLLWSDGRYFLQVLEGSDESMSATFARIARDPRHTDLLVLHDRPIETREFGGWSMIHRRTNDRADAYDEKVQRLMVNASSTLQEHFFTLIASGATPPPA